MILTWPVAFRGIPSTIPNPAKTARIAKTLDYYRKIEKIRE